jgi:hypothetical protein
LVRNWEELGNFIVKIYSDEEFSGKLSSKIHEFYLRNRGIADRVYMKISSWR